MTARCLWFSLWLLSGSAWASSTTLTLGVLDTGIVKAEHWQYMTQQLDDAVPDYRIELQLLSIDEISSAVMANQVDLLLTSPTHFIALSELRAFSSVLGTLRLQWLSQDFSTVGGALVRRVDRTELDQLDHLKGKRIALLDTSLLSTYGAVLQRVQEQGIGRQDWHIEFQDHRVQALFNAVQAEWVDVAFVPAGALEVLAERGEIDADHFAIIAATTFPDFPWLTSTGLLPGWPLLAQRYLDSEVVRSLISALMLLDFDGQAGILDGFNPSADYQPVDQLLRQLNLPPYALDEQMHHFFHHYRVRWLSGAIIVGVLCLSFVVLLRTIRRLRRARYRTERMGSELRHERRHLQQILDTVQALIVQIDTQGRVVLINRFAQQLLKRQEHELVGQSWFEVALPQPEGVALIFPMFSQMLAEASPQEATNSFENPVIDCNGELHTIAWSNTLLFDENNQPAGALSAGIDISHSRQLELHGQRQEALFQTASESADVGGWSYDIQSGELHWTHHSFVLHGLAVESDIDLERWLDCYHASYREQLQQRLQDIDAVSWELDVPLADNTSHWLCIEARTLIEKNQKTSIVGAFRDVSEHHRSEQLFRQLADVLSVGSGSSLHEAVVLRLAQTIDVKHVLLLGCEGEHDMPQQLAACSHGRLLGDLKFVEIKNSPTLQVLRRGFFLITRFVAQRYPSDPFINTTAADSYLGVRIDSSDGQVLGVLAVLDDAPIKNADLYREVLRLVAMRIATDLQQKQMQHTLHTSNLSNLAFLISTSREFRSSMNVVHGSLQLLKNSGAMSGTQSNWLNQALLASDRLLRLLNDTMDYAQLDSGQVFLHPEPIRLAPFFDEVQLEIKAHAQQHGRLLQLMVDATITDLHIHLDRAQFKHLLIFLAAVGQSRLASTSETAVLAITIKNQVLHISLSPISPAFLSIGTDVSWSPELSHDNNSYLLDLEMAICRRIVRLFNGRLRFDPLWSEPASIPSSEANKAQALESGKLLALLIEMPCTVLSDAQLAASNADAQLQGVGLWSGYKVLLVEDNEVNVMIVSEMLAQRQIDVVVASNGREAVELSQKIHFDLALMDVLMPEMDGLEATSIILGQQPWKPIVAMTASALATDRQRCREVGMADFLAKPIESEALETILRRWLGDGATCRT